MNIYSYILEVHSPPSGRLLNYPQAEWLVVVVVEEEEEVMLVVHQPQATTTTTNQRASRRRSSYCGEVSVANEA